MPHFRSTIKEIHGFLNLSKLSIELMILYSAHSQYDKRFVTMNRSVCWKLQISASITFSQIFHHQNGILHLYKIKFALTMTISWSMTHSIASCAYIHKQCVIEQRGCRNSDGCQRGSATAPPSLRAPQPRWGNCFRYLEFWSLGDEE